MADPGGLKLSALSQRSDCSLSGLSLIFFSFHGLWLLSALPPCLFFSPLRTVEQCWTRRHLTVTHFSLHSRGTDFPACLCTFSKAQLLYSYEYLLTPEYQRAEAGWGLLSRATSLLFPLFEREFGPTGSSSGSTPSLSIHKGSRERQNNLFQQYQLKTICSAFLWPCTELRGKAFAQFKVLKEYFSFFMYTFNNINVDTAMSKHW